MRIKLIIAFLFSSLGVFSQPNQQCIVVKGLKADVGKSMVISNDSGYVIAGSTSSFGAGGYDLYVVKLNSNGALQWTRTVGGTGDDYGNSIAKSTDGGYLVAGQTTSFGAGSFYSVYLIKLNSAGSVQWKKSIGGTNSQDGEAANSVISTSDGGYAVVGSTTSFGAGKSDVYFIKLDSGGSIQWTKTVGGANNEGGFSVVQCNDGGYAIAGNVDYGGKPDIYVLKLGNTGVLQWTKTIATSGYDWTNSIIQTNDGGFAVAGYTDAFGFSLAHRGYLIKLNNAGALQWTKIIGGNNDDISPDCIIQNADGSYVLGGADITGGSSDATVIKLDSTGALKWETILGEGSSSISSISALPNGGYAMCGITFWDYNSSENVFFAKITSGGTTCAPYGGSTYSYSVTLTSGSGGVLGIGSGIVGSGGTSGTGGVWVNECALAVTLSKTNTCSTICNGTATAIATGGLWPYTYLWNNGQTTPTATGLCAGSYTLTLKDATSSTLKKTVSLTQAAPLTATAYSFSSDTICPGGCDTIIANVTGGSGTYTYLWSPGNMTTDWVKVCPSLPTSYAVTVTNICGTYTPSSVFVFIDQCTGIETFSNTLSISIVPNPTKDVITIESSEKISSVEILNILGETVYSSYNNLRLPTFKIDLRGEPKGIYFYKITCENETGATGKIVIQ